MSRLKKVILWVVGIAIALTILSPLAYHWWLRYRLESYLTALKEKREPIEIGQVVPFANNNGVSGIQLALANLYQPYLFTNLPTPMRLVAPGHAIVAWQQPDIRQAGQGTNSWEQLSATLDVYKADLDALRGLDDKVSFDFHLNYYQGFALPLPHLGQYRHALRVLSAAADCHLHQGDSASACADVRAMLAIVKGQEFEPIIVSQRVHINSAHIAAAATWETLQARNVSESDLARLQREWESFEFLAPMQHAFQMERAVVLHEMDKFRHDPNSIRPLIGASVARSTAVSQNPVENIVETINPERMRIGWENFNWQLFWSYDDELRSLKIVQVMIDASRLASDTHSAPKTEAFINTNLASRGIGMLPTAEDSSYRGSLDLQSFLSRGMLSCGGYTKKALEAETVRNLVIGALAARRYAIRIGHPRTAAELSPDFLQTVLMDDMNGQPLHWRAEENGGFYFYSVGENGLDDHGSSKMSEEISPSKDYWLENWLKGLDWVLPQPATPQETKKAEEEFIPKRSE